MTNSGAEFPPLCEPRHISVGATALVHEHLATIMTFAYSRHPLRRLIGDHFEGEWKYLGKALFDIPEGRAERALIELGLYIRMIDDAEQLSKAMGEWSFGHLVAPDGKRDPLKMREVANKIIHADRYAWELPDQGRPHVTCFAPADQADRFGWRFVSIDLISLAALCGRMMS